MTDSDKKIFLTLTDDEAMAIVIAGEARGEKDESRQLVGSIILNRVDYGQKHKGWGHAYGDSIKSVCAAPDQFSCLSSNDKNYPLLMQCTHDFAGGVLRYVWLQECQEIAAKLILGTLPRSCQGIFYEEIGSHGLYDRFMARDKRPPRVELVVGNFKIYKEV